MLRERLSREAIGIAVLVVLALVCAGLITAVVVKTRNDAAAAAREAAAYTPPPLASASPSASAGGPVIAVLGDATALSSPSSTAKAERWPALVAGAVDGTATTIQAAGYAASAQDESFATAATQVPQDADVVIVAGATVDPTASPVSLAKAASTVYAAVKQQAPAAKLVVVEPFLRSGGTTAALTSLTDSLKSAARLTGAKYLDPLADGWITSATATTLSAANQKTVASKMRSAVASAARSGD